jgi:nucleotide-binding universal stress UspA family protein
MGNKHVVVGVTESATSQHAARTALAYAESIGATLHVITAVHREDKDVVAIGQDRWEFSSVDQARGNVTHFVSSWVSSVPCTVTARVGDPAEILVEEAQRVGADLIVVGNVRMQGPTRVLGSVGAHVLRHAPCDVLIVKTV